MSGGGNSGGSRRTSAPSKATTTTTAGKDARSSQLAKEAKVQRSILKEYLSSASDKAGGSGSLPSLTGPNSDLEFARKNLRNTYLNLLFTCTFTRSAHGVDSSLWVETTHPLAHLYRKHLSRLESVIAAYSNAAPGPSKDTGKRGPAASTGNTRKARLNEYHRVASEFRKFLISEETFWQELAARIVHTFQLHEAKPLFDTLGIVYDTDTSTITTSSSAPPASSAGQAHPSSSQQHTRGPDHSLESAARNAGNGSTSSAGMSRIQGAGSAAFTSATTSAAEAAAQVKAATIPSNRDRLIEIVHKAFICGGDLARYRAELSDKPSDAASRAPKPTPDYSRASSFYTQARLLIPDNGNPSNQLAVISVYTHDSLGAIHHYYRALCCRVPFETARGNLENTLSKSVKWWADRMEEVEIQRYREAQAAAGAVVDDTIRPRLRHGWRPRRLREEVAEKDHQWNPQDHTDFIELWSAEFLALHGLFHRKTHFTSLEALNQLVVSKFSLLVENRALTPDAVSQVIVSGLSASWVTRLWRNTAAGNGHSNSGRKSGSSTADHATSNGKGKGREVTSKIRSEEDGRFDPSEEDEDDELLPAGFSSEQCQAIHLSIENQLVAHVLQVIRVLFDVGTRETRGVLQNARRGTVTSAGGQATRLPAAQERVTAVFRRVLPALRVAMKWIKGHLEYIQRCKDRALTSSQSSSSDSHANSSLSLDRIPNGYEREVLLAKSRADGGVVESIFSFWRSFVDFINVLRFAFPWDDLPSLDTLGPLGAPALCLEEDLDLRGFSPTKKAMLPHGNGGMGEACAAIGLSQALPSEEQLMRIADLLIDAKVVAESQNSPIAFDDERNAFMYAVPDSAEPVSSSQHPQSVLNQSQEDRHAEVVYGTGAPKGQDQATAVALASAAAHQTSIADDAGEGEPRDGATALLDAQLEAGSEGFSESTEDVVDMAMRAVDHHSAALNNPSGVTGAGRPDLDQQDDDDEEDMILVPAVRDLWSHRPLGPPAAPAAGSPLRTAQLPLPASGSPAQSAGLGNPAFPQAGSPYLDARNLSSSGPGPSSSSTAQPALLFGGMGANSHTPVSGHRASIWSPGPLDMRSATPQSAGVANIWGPPGAAVGGTTTGVGGNPALASAVTAMPSPNYAAAQAFVSGGLFSSALASASTNPPATSSHLNGAPGLPLHPIHAPYAIDPRLQASHNDAYGQRQPPLQSSNDDPFLSRGQEHYAPYFRAPGR
ncbi:hypothetical protein OC846_001236 [Tilletia horrida]|uniref:DNA/RNA-binding domain-containing protein n=1 Tax=Tilletia horrida TaxID=155126 RepID=A0AAN6GU83_9BASI|nr:hypothetical protein OC846_001236 [Tilletia horrida]